MGKKKVPVGAAVQAVQNVKQFWCYYCETRCEDEYKLIQHQRSKHFLCRLCDPNAYGRNCLSLSGLVSHVRRSHRKEVKEVPNAIPSRLSLEVEVSAMNGIPQEALDEFRAQLHEEMQEAMASAPADPEPDEPPQQTAFQAHQQQRQQHAEMPPVPEEYNEEPPMPSGPVHTPVMPHFAQMAQQLANQLAADIPAPFQEERQRNSEPAAFDPAMLAARLKAAEEEAKRQEALEKDEAEERARREEPRRRSRSRSPRATEDDEGNVTFTVQGKLGMACEPDTGVVAEVLKDGKAGKLGVRSGWAIVSLDDIPYSAKLLGEKNNGPDEYKITFKKARGGKRDEPRASDAARSAPARPQPRYRAAGSRSRKPQRGSLKFRPRSMNRSQERAERRTNLEERQTRGLQDMEGSGRKREGRDEREKGERGAPREDDDRRTKDYLRRREETDKDYSRRRDDDRRDDRRDDDRPPRDNRDDDRRPARAERGEGRRERSRSERREVEEPAPPPDDKFSDKPKRKSRWNEEEPPEVMPMAQMMSMGTKTELCMAFTEGLCTKGDMCVYAHSLRELAPGGYKPRLCPSFMRGNCPRKTQCLYAHSKEELPPNFKCILCRNYTSGFCRKQQICTLAHGEDEQVWFVRFMGELATDAGKGGGKKGAQPGPMAPGMVRPAGPAAIMDGGGMGALADNVMMAAQKQLMSGQAMPGQLAIEGGRPQMPMKPSFQPKINLANNPAMKAASAVAAMKASASSKAGGGVPNMMPPGMMPPGMMAPSFAKFGQDGPGAFGKGGSPAPAPRPWVPPGAGGVSPRPWVPPGAGLKTALENKIALAMGKAAGSADSFGAMAKGKASAPSGPQPCMRFEMGGCSLGDDCPFAHIVSAQ